MKRRGSAMLNKLKIEAAIAMCLLLGSCGPYHSVGDALVKAEIAQKNAVTALNKCNELEYRLLDIESRLNM